MRDLDDAAEAVAATQQELGEAVEQGNPLRDASEDLAALVQA